jgi:hypothetical protein
MNLLPSKDSKNIRQEKSGEKYYRKMQELLNNDDNTLMLKCGPAGIRKSAWSFRTIIKTGIPCLIQNNLIIVSCIGVRE